MTSVSTGAELPTIGAGATVVPGATECALTGAGGVSSAFRPEQITHHVPIANSKTWVGINLIAQSNPPKSPIPSNDCGQPLPAECGAISRSEVLGQLPTAFGDGLISVSRRFCRSVSGDSLSVKMPMTLKGQSAPDCETDSAPFQ